MTDQTEATRRQLVSEINSNPSPREEMEAIHGKVWNTGELCEDFEVMGFLAPYVFVKRKVDGVKGTLEFQHSPRVYYQFLPGVGRR